jgi:hypothetical protein
VVLLLAGMSESAARDVACEAVWPTVDRTTCLSMDINIPFWQELRRVRSLPWTNPPTRFIRASPIADRLVTYYQDVLRLEAAMARYGYPLTEGHCGMCPTKIEGFFQLMASSPHVKTVCEIGFNGGHSALAWLSSRPDVEVRECRRLSMLCLRCITLVSVSSLACFVVVCTSGRCSATVHPAGADYCTSTNPNSSSVLALCAGRSLPSTPWCTSTASLLWSICWRGNARVRSHCRRRSCC